MVPDKSVVDLLERVNQNLEACVATKSVVEGHQKTLYGQNGRSGLVADVIHMDHNIDDLKETFDSMSKWIKWGVGIMITVGLATLGILVTHLQDASIWIEKLGVK